MYIFMEKLEGKAPCMYKIYRQFKSYKVFAVVKWFSNGAADERITNIWCMGFQL